MSKSTGPQDSASPARGWRVTACILFVSAMLAVVGAPTDVANATSSRATRRAAREPAIRDAIASVTVGDLTYVASGERGLQILEAGAKRGARPIGRVSFAGEASDVEVAGGYAYVAAGGAGVQVVDVSNPKTPFVVGACADVYARALEIVGRQVYVASEYQGVTVIDVTDPTDPTLVDTIATSGSANDIVTDQGKLLVTDTTAGVVVLDVNR